MKKLMILLMLLLAACLLCACDEEPQLNEQQLACEHEWVEVDWKFGRKNGTVIYCPKCKLEDAVDFKTWKIIQVDAEYRAEMEGE